MSEDCIICPDVSQKLFHLVNDKTKQTTRFNINIVGQWLRTNSVMQMHEDWGGERCEKMLCQLIHYLATGRDSSKSNASFVAAASIASHVPYQRGS